MLLTGWRSGVPFTCQLGVPAYDITPSRPLSLLSLGVPCSQNANPLHRTAFSAGVPCWHPSQHILKRSTPSSRDFHATRASLSTVPSHSVRHLGHSRECPYRALAFPNVDNAFLSGLLASCPPFALTLRHPPFPPLLSVMPDAHDTSSTRLSRPSRASTHTVPPIPSLSQSSPFHYALSPVTTR